MMVVSARYLELTRLQAWGPAASGSAAVVRAPRPNEDKIHIVLNKNARKWNDMVYKVDAHLSAPISVVIASLKVVDDQGGMRDVADPLINGRLMSEAYNGYVNSENKLAL
jgi:hypothetical protein